MIHEILKKPRLACKQTFIKASDFEKNELVTKINSCQGKISDELRRFVKNNFIKNALSVAEKNKQLTARNKELQEKLDSSNAINAAKISGYESQVE